jgi:hypothetical protein
MNSKFKRLLICWIIPIALSCTQVMLIGAYDETVDTSIQKISSGVSVLLIEIEKNIRENRTEENKYDNFRNTYVNIEGDVESLKIRTGALPKYKIITGQVDALSKSIQDLDSLHRIGFALKDTFTIRIVKSNLETSFQSMLMLQNELKREK